MFSNKDNKYDIVVYESADILKLLPNSVVWWTAWQFCGSHPPTHVVISVLKETQIQNVAIMKFHN